MRVRELNAKRRWCTQKKAFEKDCLETIQKKTEDAAKEIPHSTKLEKDREDRAVARSLRPDERRVLRRQARKARAAHLVKCSLALGQRRILRNPLKELHIDGEFSLKTGGLEEGTGEILWRSLCRPEDIIEEQRQRIAWYTKKKGSNSLPKNPITQQAKDPKTQTQTHTRPGEGCVCVTDTQSHRVTKRHTETH